MSGGESGHGLQVVKVCEGAKERYQLDAAALERLLLRENVRDKPVAVVSVAGAYRGGKSFLLDFFLRYLNAPRSSQQNGEWLGGESEPLRGFSWRAGCERETTGIHFWSQPIHVKLETTGEEVVLLLMDTQGTFDSESTIQDSSTIFALSTLVASLQIYNIFRNIKEDDLQHLHLFTDYGRLASDGVKAFQVLQFLVRDWPNAHEHQHGYKGGSSLLARRLEMKDGQNKELRDVRQHLRSCFDDIRCFLMPHPGLTTEDPTFNGCLSDISEKFRMGLLELVPSIFDPNHLTPKMIGGNRVKGRDLCVYFQKYMEIFNSEELPPAVTILQGMAAASFMSLMREARETYESNMERAPAQAGSVTAATVRARHCAARDAAVQLFHGKRKLGSEETAEEYLEQLVKELDARLPLYIWQNEAQVREDCATSKKVYDDAFTAVSESQKHLCLHPGDLQNLHSRVLGESLADFDSRRMMAEGEVDEDRIKLQQQLTEQYEHLCSINEQNNNSAVLEARVLYVAKMKDSLPYQSGVSTDSLQSHHEKALHQAAALFKSKRNRPTKQTEDQYLQKLLEHIDEEYVEFERLNLKSNKLTLSAAEHTYNTFVASAWGPQSCCFHPEGLEELHRNALEAAIKDFLQNRAESDEDDYKAKLISILEKRYSDLEEINKYNNEQAIDMAFMEYSRRMDKHCAPSLSSILIGPFIVKLLLAMPHHHQRGTQEAISEFRRRRRGSEYSDDDYLDRLKRRISEAYENYRNPIQALIRELGLPVPN